MTPDPTPSRTCVKTGYPTAAKAAKALHAAHKRTPKIRLYRYRCAECGEWHLTRMDPVKVKRRLSRSQPSHV